MPSDRSFRRRFVAATIHLLCSALIAAAVSVLVFLVWYPPPYATIAGGASLFTLLVGVDVVLGPLLTLVVANPSKSRSELTRDLFVIVLFQLSGFGYGIYSVALARPVALAFEVDRFRVVTAADVDLSSLEKAPASLRALSWTGPRLIGATKPTDPAEQMRSMDLGMSGIDLSMVPSNWVPYAQVKKEVLRHARPASLLIGHYPSVGSAVAELAAKAGISADQLRFLPLVSRKASWVTLISLPNADVVGHLPIDGFF